MTRPPSLVPALVAPTGPLADLADTVATKVPPRRPETFIRVLAAGGALTAEYSLAAPSAIVECWAATTDAAYDLASAAWERLRATAGTELGPGLWIQEARLTLPVDFPDTQSGSPRWQFIFTPTVAQEET